MTLGQKLYTFNAYTNEVEEWEYRGTLNDRPDPVIALGRGKQYTFLPKRCIYETEAEALQIAGQQKIF